MDPTSEHTKPNILILATLSGGYEGANAVGQLHANYPANTSILPVRCPSMFPEKFYLDTFKQGIDGIIVMYSGTDSPYKGGPERAAKIINQTYVEMKAQGLDTRRLRLAAICTVCTAPFQKEVALMNATLEEIGLVNDELAEKGTV